MSITHQEAVTRLRELVETSSGGTVAVEASEIRLLLERCEALEREKDDMLRRSAKAMEMLDAATIFLKAYGEKYRNFASGGIRPTAILQSEVKVMWAVFNEFRGMTESETKEPDPVRELWPRRSAGMRG